MQHAEHDKRNAAGGAGSSYALTFAAGDIRNEKQSRYNWQPAPALSSEPILSLLSVRSSKPFMNSSSGSRQVDADL